MKTLLSAFVILISVGIHGQELILQPNINPQGTKVAFSFQGDIWVVGIDGGRADRLTIHEGYDGHPKWSPDGNTIGFQSDRYGNFDIFTIPANGGSPKRLTYHSANDAISEFSPQGSILFTTRRIYAQVEREWEIYEANPAGGTPSRYMDAVGFDPVTSPDNSKIAFVRGTCRVAREAYRGPANRNIWIYDKNSGEYSQLTDFDGNDFNPLWLNDNSILYISSKSGRYNVHRISLDGNDQQLTTETVFGVNSFSTDGNRIVYQYGDQVALYDMESESKSLLSFDVSSDFRFDPEISKTVSDNVSEYKVSPNGKLSAYVYRGEVFVTRNDKEDKRSVRVTNSSARERDVTWLNDETLLFVSDRNGQYDLLMARSSDNEENNLFKTLKRSVFELTNTPEEEFDPIVSPDGKKIAFRRDRGQLLTASISSSGTLSNITVLQNGWDTPGSISWSPDSKWLAYSISDINFNEDVYIHAADGSSQPVNVSMHPKYDGNPKWSPDGKKLGFISYRNNGDSDIWFAWLTKEDWEKSKEKWKREAKEADENDSDEEESDEVKVVIDFDGLYQRLTQVTSYSGNESDFSFDKKGEMIYYSLGSPGRQNFKVDRNLYKIKWDGTEKKEILTGDKRPSSLQLTTKGDHLFALTKGGKIIRVKTKDDKNENLSVSSKMTVNTIEERSQIFEEGWRALNAGFYDPNFHGRDFNELKNKYKPLAMKASTNDDFQYIYNLMLGQLDASHMGLRNVENPKETQRLKTGLIGVEGENVSNGFKINRILPKSPASKAESRLNVGDVITSVDQMDLSVDGNFFKMMADKANSPVLLGVNDGQGNFREVVIWPETSLSNQLYDDWVNTRRELTEAYSNGRLGYLHIRGMNWTSFERFERELMAAGYGKEGIVIDVRYNGGGWTTDYLMAVLNVRQHAYTIPRGAADNLDAEHLKFKETYPFAERLPLASWTKPSIAMCNENSYSNAEIFSHAYKTLDIGTLVGKPTFGAVISTGSWGLVDGSYVRMPFRAWYVKATEENMEHGPAVPDIDVSNPPAYKALGSDPQLERAVDELINQIDN